MNGAIILAAGSGTRYHGKKQDLIFHEKPIWRYAYETALSVVGEGNIVAVGKDIQVVLQEQGSVMNGLRLCQKEIDSYSC